MRLNMNRSLPNIIKHPHVTDKGKSADDKRKYGKDGKSSITRSAINGRPKETSLKEKRQSLELKDGACLLNGQKYSPGCRKSHTKTPPSQASECDQQPRQDHAVDSKREDDDSQVDATDIQSTVGVQTSETLLLRGPELPQRRPSGRRAVTPRKHPYSCDCEQTLPLPTTERVQISTQTEPWQVSSLEHAQTGPSLTAVGPFSRFDYTLKKTKVVKDDTFCHCCPADRPREDVSCSQKWSLRPSVDQQVTSLDINVSELLQTEDHTEAAEQTGRVICGCCLGQALRSTYKDHTLADCECSSDWDGRHAAKRTQGFSAQVGQADISPTKCTQTDLCLWLDVCKKSRFYPGGYWICGFRQLCQSPLRMHWTSVKDFSQQVTATDIGDSKETQTCLHLMLAKAFCTTCSRLTAQSCGQGFNQRVLIGRARSFRTDRCEACGTAPSPRSVLDVGTQVKLFDTGFSTETQTCDPNSHRTLCFIRRGQWASKTWH